MTKLYLFGQRVIDFFWLILFGTTLFKAWTSINLILGDNSFYGTSTTLLTTFGIIFLVVFFSLYHSVSSIHEVVYHIFVENWHWTASFLLILVIAFQLFFVINVHPVSGFDAGMLHYAAVSKKHVLEPNVAAYYSLNQNNLPITLVMRWLVVKTGQTSWLFFDLLTVALVDLSAFLNLGSIYCLKPAALPGAIYLHCGWLFFFPSIIMPYTDAWVLPFVSLYLLCSIILTKPKLFLGYRLVAAVLFGISAVLTYWIKPSAIIPVIAMVLILILRSFKGLKTLMKGHWADAILITIVLMESAGVTYRQIDHSIKAQTYIKVDQSRAIPAIHFMAMGVYGQGGYSEKQAVKMTILPTKQQKTAYSKKMLIKRLKALGTWGYFKFLITKQGNNTADGTFGWLREGHFFRENQKPSDRGISNRLKNYIYLYGRHIADFRFWSQAWWVFFLSLIALGWGRRSDEIQTLRLSLIGGFLFLLLFEGGRSRYVIQYLPVLLVLAALSVEQAQVNWKKLWQWTKPSPDSP